MGAGRGAPSASSPVVRGDILRERWVAACFVCLHLRIDAIRGCASNMIFIKSNVLPARPLPEAVSF